MTPHRFTAAVVLTKYNGCTVSTQAEAVGFKVHGWAKNAAKTKAEAMKQERRQLHWTSYRGGQCGALPTPVASRSSIKQVSVIRRRGWKAVSCRIANASEAQRTGRYAVRRKRQLTRIPVKNDEVTTTNRENISKQFTDYCFTQRPLASMLFPYDNNFRRQFTDVPDPERCNLLIDY